jgi:hypothetical protein
MAVQHSIPSQRIIRGNVVKSYEVSIVTDNIYKTNGESLIVTKTNDTKIQLDSFTTDHVIIKSLTNTKIIPLMGLIDEEYSEINIGKGASVELYFAFGNWYVVSSDGIKEEGLY